MALDFSNIVDKREPREDRQPEPQQAPPEQQDFGGSITIPQSMWDEFDRNLGTPELATNYDKNYVAPVEDFNPYQAEPSQTVVEAQDKYNQINIATQEYADEMTRRIIDDHNGYMTDDNYQGMLNRTYTDQVYDYIRRANKGADDSAWEKPNPQDDLYSKWLPDWIAAEDIRRQGEQKMSEALPTEEQKVTQNIRQNVYDSTSSEAQRAIMDSTEIEHGNWNLLGWWDKAKYLLMPGSSATTMDDAPDWAKYIQNIFPSAMAGGAGAMVGGTIAGPVGATVGAVAVGALTYLEGVTDVNIPIINEALELLDLPSIWFEQAQGAAGAALSEAKNRLENEDHNLLDLLKTTGEILQENPYLFEVGKYSYESSADLGFDDLALFIRNTGAKFSDEYLGTNFGQRDISEISRANLGRGELEEVVEGTQGYQALYDTYLPVFEGLVNEAQKNGMTERDAIQFAHQNMEEYLINYMGTSGLGRDLVASSVADPLNFAPYVTAKLSEGMGKITGDTALQNAGKAAAGNVIIDALPPVVQQIAEAVTGKHGSQGIDTIKQTWIENTRAMTDVSKLSGWQKYMAGIDSEGKIKGYDANPKTGNAVVDWFRNLTKQTNESKMLDISQTSTDFLGSAIFNYDLPLSYLPDLIEQATGRTPITPDSPLARFQNTALMNTLKEVYSGVDNATIDNIRFEVQNYRKYGENRTVLKHVAEELGMTDIEVLNALDNTGINPKDPRYKDMSKREKRAALDAERRDLFKRIEDAGITYTDADGNVMDTSKVIKEINVFKKHDADKSPNTVGRRQYSDTYLRAAIMDDIATKVDQYNLKKYGITPDNWAVRTSNLMKSLQSIALLNFSTSYQVNNFLNNMLTRSVVGVGGGSTGKMNTVNEKRGLSFTRDSDTFQRTQDAIKQKKKANDGLQKVTDLYNNFNRDAHILKGVNAIPIEEIETKNAFNIGANRYWEATWGNNIPEIPQAWEAIGITKDMKQAIWKLALDSPDYNTFQQKLAGDVIFPKSASSLAQMLDNNYDTNSAKVIRDFFSTKPWIADMIDGFMETGNEQIIRKGFEDVMNRFTNDVSLQNVVQLDSTFDDLRNTYADQGFGAIANAFEAINDLYSQIWIEQTKENSTLFLDRVVGAINPNEFDKRYSARMQTQMNDYRIARGYTVMNIAAMIDGLGIDTDTGLAFLNNAIRLYDLGEEYVKLEHQIHDKYGVRASQNFDFRKYYSDKIDLCSKTLNAQLDASKAMNKTMVDYLRNNLDDSWTGHIDNFEKSLNDVIALKEAENKAEIAELRRRMNTNNRHIRENVSIKQEKPRVQRKQQIHDGYENAAKMLKQFENAMQNKPAPAAPSTIESTWKMEMLYDEAKHMSDSAGSFLKKYKDGADPKKVYEPVNYENSKVKTSFVDYGKEVMRQRAEEAVKAGRDPLLDLQRTIAEYSVGEAVTLGTVDASKGGAKFLDPNSLTWIDHPVLDHFQLLNPDADPKVTGSKFSMARSEPYLYGGDIVNAGVFYNNKIIAYITEGMKQTIEVDGKTYPVIGVSPENPNALVLYVQDKPRTVTPGKPANVEFSMYAKDNFHPGAIGSTPTIEPWGKVALESSFAIRDAMNRWRDQAITDLRKAQTNGSVLGKMTDAQRLAVRNWMEGDLRQAYNAQRYQTQRYAETMVDAALLNYNKRYGFDNALTMISPYQYWMTRSLANWGKRMISEPAWFSMYSRIEKLIEKNKKDFLPTRLEGLIGIPMPNMGDGMGDSFFFDIFNTIFPFQQFYNATDYFTKNINTIHQNTLTRIDDMFSEGELFNGMPITDEMYDEALQGKGDLYWAIYNQEKENDESDVSMGGLLGTFMGPPVWFDTLRKHMSGKDKDISYSPMFRTGNMIKAMGDNTFAEDITNMVGNIMQAPENLMRKALGIESNPDGNYADYGINSIISFMLIDKKIDYNEAVNAIAEGPGNKIYDDALYTYRQQQAQKMQGGALATEVGQWIGGNKDTSVGQLAGSALVSAFGAKTLPQGEEMHRERQALYSDVRKTGDKELKKQFWNAFPEYKVRNYSYEDDPEKRLHQILVDNMSNAYYALPNEQKNLVADAFGDRFKTLFVNPDTKATDHLEDSEIIEWTRAMQGNVPNLTDEQINGPMQEAQEIAWYSDSVLGKIDRYNKEKDQKFPGWKEVQDGYYDTPEDLQAQYKIDNPMLDQMWEWDNAVRRANPDLDTYLNTKSASGQVYYKQYDNITQAMKGRVSDWIWSELDNYNKYGFAMKPSAEQSLRRTYAGLNVKVPYEEWLKSFQK